jgi:hypothetical protein
MLKLKSNNLMFFPYSLYFSNYSSVLVFAYSLTTSWSIDDSRCKFMSEYTTVYLVVMLLCKKLYIDVSCGPRPKVLTVLFILKVSLKTRECAQVLIILWANLSHLQLLFRDELAHPLVPRYRLRIVFIY